MTRFLKHYGIAAIAALGIIASCGEDSSTTPDVNFDRKAMLQNIADNIITLEYTVLKTKVLELDAKLNQFTATPDAAHLQEARTAFQATYLAWQHTSAFEFGPASDRSFRANVNTFPTDVTHINSKIQSSTYSFETIDDWATMGLPAIEFMLYGAGSEEEVLKLYTENTDALKNKEYLKAISAELKKDVVFVVDSWSGSFKDQFINNTGTDAGSSLSILVNQLNFDWEIIKNPKIGLPLGVKTMGEKLPKHVEAYYSGNSVKLAIEHANAIANLYKGGAGLGLDDYLNAHNAQHGNISLDAAIQSQFSNTVSALNAISGPLSEAVVKNPSTVQTAYNELQKNSGTFKNRYAFDSWRNDQLYR